MKDYCIHLLVSGFTMVWKKYNGAFGVFDNLELIVISTDTDVTGFGRTSLTTVVNGKEETIKYTDIIFFYDNQKLNDSVKGLARLIPLRSQIENVQIAQKGKNIQMLNAGITIVSPKSSSQGNSVDEGLDKPIIAPIQQIGSDGKQIKLKTQKEEMEDRLNSRGMENRIIVSSKGVDAKNLSAELNSFNFSEKVEADILAIFYAFGVSEELTPFGKRGTFDNKGEAENNLIESEIYPMSNSLLFSLNSEFVGRGNIYASYDHLSSVAKTKESLYKAQKDIAETCDKLFSSEIITKEEARELLTKNGVL